MSLLSGEGPADVSDLDPLTLRPRLRRDTVMLPSRDGVFLRNATMSIHVKGGTAYRWLAALSPLLDGEHTLAEICSGMAEPQRTTVTRLVGQLRDTGFILDAERRERPLGATGAGMSEVPAPPLAPAVRQRFQAQIEFLDHLAPGAVPRFARFRAARILLTGNGESLGAAASGLLRNGAASIDVAPGGPHWPHREGVRTEAERLRANGVGVDVRLVEEVDPASGYDLVISCTDRAGLRPVSDLNRRCQAGGPPLVPLVVMGDRALLGPVVRPGHAPCWLCAQLRLTATIPPEAAADTWRELALGAAADAAEPATPAVARMLGNAVAFEAFRLLTGLPAADTDGAVVLQDLRTMESVREPLLPHPECRVCGPAAHCPPPDAAAPLDDEDRLSRCQVLVGEQVGVFAGYADAALPQLPLKTARLRLAPGRRRAGHRDITAFHPENLLRARLQVVRAAAREYAGRLGQHRATVTGRRSDLVARGARPVPTERLTTWATPGRWYDDQVTAWMPARELGGPGKWLVPMAAAFPLGAANPARLVEHTCCGLAAGWDVDEVVTEGLGSLLAYRALRGLVDGTARVVEVTEDVLVDDTELAYLATSVRRFGPRVRLVELADAAPGHAVVAAARGGPDQTWWTVGYAPDGRQAVARALGALLGRLQTHEAEGRPPDTGTPLLAGWVPPEQWRYPTTRSRLADPPLSSMGAIGKLWAAGATPLFVDTTTPDLAAGGLVCGVVLLLEPVSGHDGKGGDEDANGAA